MNKPEFSIEAVDSKVPLSRDQNYMTHNAWNVVSYLNAVYPVRALNNYVMEFKNMICDWTKGE